MANTIQLRILDSKQIIAEMSGMPLASENSYRIIAGEENATEFEIVQKPTAYENATYYVYFINSLGERAFLGDVIPDPLTNDGQEIVNDTFVLPKGMAVAGYGYIRIYCLYNDEKVEFQRIKVKIWETVPTYHNYVRPLETIATEEWVEELFAKKNGTYPQLNAGHASTADEAENAEYLLVDGTPRNGVYFKNLIDGKVQSNTTDTTSDGSVYVSKASGGVKNDLLIPIGSSAGNIVKRNTNGNVTTGTPTSAGEATNKAYVDNQLIGLEGVVVFKSQIGQANGVAPLDANGKLPVGLVPSIELKDYIQVSSEAELQTINAQIGDVAYLAETIDGKLTVTNSWWFVDIDTTQEPPYRIWAVLNTVYAENALLAQKANALMVSGNPKSGDTIQGEIDYIAGGLQVVEQALPGKVNTSDVDSTQALTPNKVVQRNASGNVETGTATTDKEVLNKQYADDNLAYNNGSYDAMSVGDANHSTVADNLTPYSEDSGTTQENPFISQGTGTDNNSVIVTTGTIAKQLEKQGNTLQIVQLANTRSGSGTDTASGSVIDILLSNISNDCVVGHKYFVSVNVIVSDSTKLRSVRVRNPFVSSESSLTTTKQTYYFVGEATETTSPKIQIIKTSSEASGESYSYENAMFVDITSWDSSIITDLTSHPEHFSWYYNGSFVYDAGSLANCNGRYLECGQGRNLWDESISTNYYYASDGIKTSTSNYDACGNKIKVIPNSQIIITKGTESTYSSSYLYGRFFDKDGNCLTTTTDGFSIVFGTAFTTPANASLLVFYTYFQKHFGNSPQITVSLYYTPEQGGEGYNQYYPYVAPIRIDTGTEDLLSAGSVCDVKLPSGEITHNVVDYTFVNTSGTSNETYNFGTWSSNNVSIRIPIADLPNGSPKSNTSFICSANINCTGTLVIIDGAYAYFRFLGAANTYNDLTAFQAALGTAKIHYVLATPTTTQGTPFSEYAPINDYSYMAWFDTDGNLVSIPQGCKLFYPVDYKGFTDDLVMYTNGDATALAKNEDITDSALNARGYYKMQDLLTAFGANGMVGGTLRNVLAEKFSSDFANTICIDLGDYNWSYNSSDKVFFVDITSINPSVADNGTHFVSTLYKARYQTLANLNDLEGRVLESGANKTIYFKNLSYTDTDIFKVNMKGVLVALEKA